MPLLRLAALLLLLLAVVSAASVLQLTPESVATIALDADASVLARDAALSEHEHHAQYHESQALANGSNPTEAALIIGVKTSLIHGFESRQAIRETWARPSSSKPLGVRVLFLGCSPDLSTLPATERSFTQRAISLEKATYHDLLTDELRCEDSFATLVDKTVEFMYHINSTASPFVMVADDDVFLRLDRLMTLLQSDRLPRERLYAGNEAREGQRKPSPPVRDPKSKYYLSEDVYPMSELPPFVAGAHYIVSRDIVDFIARNRDDLQGLGGLDDVTMALWMLALQVHPVFLDGFDVLRNTPCSDDFISYADLSPSAILHIQQNIDRGVSVCANYSYESWSKENTSITFSDTADATVSSDSVEYDWNIKHDSVSQSLHIEVGLRIQGTRVALTYVPSASTYDASFCSRLLSLVRAKLYLSVDTELCSRHRNLLLAFLEEDPVGSASIQAKMAIALHNLERSAADEAAGVKSPTLVIALSTNANYARVLVECIYTQMHADRHIVVVGEHELTPHSPPPHVFVFSILDTVGKPPPTGAEFVRRYASSQLLMISGEAYATQGLDPRVTLLSTVESPRHNKHIDLPQASAMFGETVRHHPLELLQPVALEAKTDRRFCAYLYFNCQRATREYMFDILNDAEPVDALGKCQGTKHARDPTKETSRMSDFYIDDAVGMYRDYKFTIAFENAVVPGYITEKIVTAFLAGAVPVYYGHSATAKRLFNPKAFIDCNSFESLQACAQRVIEVHRSPTLYEAMRREAPIVDRAVFLEAFSWHPAVLELSAKLKSTGEIAAQPPSLSEKLQMILQQ